ncbi:serine threonine kinase [Fusarium circinatum]|uniref:Serine threonine kinase n=1 Tax=Fusarium circinatum TaxID=48490 RepID=A0A8H5UP65_FUSCI|nr:serine threonine kinase [Fusarium circinatum]
MLNKEGDNNKEASAPDSDDDQAELQDVNHKRSHSGAFAGDGMSSNSHPSDLLSGRPAKLKQPSTPVSDGSTPAESQESKGKSQIVAHSEAFCEKDDDWLFDHTKIILRIGHDYFAASSQQRESQLKSLDHSSLDRTLIPQDHYCPKFKEGISKAPKNLSLDDVYLKQPSLISWDAKDPNPTSIADLVLQEAEICETLKKHPHPNIMRYFGCLDEDDKIVGLVLGSRGRRWGTRGTFGWELEKAELAVPENDFHGLKKLKEYIVSGGKMTFD